MTLEEAIAQLTSAVYQATRLLEDLEHSGQLTGNGHHARQTIAQAAEKELRERWVEDNKTSQIG